MTRKRDRRPTWPRWSGAVEELYDYVGRPLPGREEVEIEIYVEFTL